MKSEKQYASNNCWDPHNITPYFFFTQFLCIVSSLFSLSAVLFLSLLSGLQMDVPMPKLHRTNKQRNIKTTAQFLSCPALLLVFYYRLAFLLGLAFIALIKMQNLKLKQNVQNTLIRNFVVSLIPCSNMRGRFFIFFII